MQFVREQAKALVARNLDGSRGPPPAALSARTGAFSGSNTLDLRLLPVGYENSGCQRLAVGRDFHPLRVDLLVFHLIRDLDRVLVHPVRRSRVACRRVVAHNRIFFAIELQPFFMPSVM